jgi:hypothetical protein
MKRVLPILLALLAVMLVVGLVTLTQRDVLLRLAHRPDEDEKIPVEPETV